VSNVKPISPDSFTLSLQAQGTPVPPRAGGLTIKLWSFGKENPGDSGKLLAEAFLKSGFNFIFTADSSLSKNKVVILVGASSPSVFGFGPPPKF